MSNIAVLEAKYPYCKFGVDLSHYDPDPDFHELAGTVDPDFGAPVEFVYLKATQGASYVDPTYADRRLRALSVRLYTGSYHFLEPLVASNLQVVNFMGAFGQMGPGELPPWLDVEAAPGWDQVTGPDRVDRVLHWLQSVEDKIQCRPIIYCSIGWWNDIIGHSDEFAAYEIAMAEYSATPANPGDTTSWPAFRSWQFRDREQIAVPGTNSTFVDTDMWTGIWTGVPFAP